jgi:hypothetical protein
MADWFRRGEVLAEGRTNEEEMALVGQGRAGGAGVIRAKIQTQNEWFILAVIASG